ncbi:PilN domain-containing protein [Halomonas cerina]|uniref:Type IV pilus assembly protein PilN n=1 Tax=Halomonas cerina TaxID=447424 RepID=A0A839VE77_9GAMM|nr:PilN domain-containing protein [Halomonas cerina]MBB3190786.1 type IV pilus assembly protein PilN [Halomonas cerina]
MTIDINLLPWREARRARRSRRFHVALVLMALIGLGGGYGMTRYYEQQLTAQQARHALIRDRMAELDRNIELLGQYEAQVVSLRAQLEVFQRLQTGRPQTVHVFNALVASLQEGVHYVGLDRQGDRLRLEGRAERNRQVSDQLRALEASPVFDVPVLSEVESSDAMRRFTLTVSQHMPATPGGEGEP